MYFICFAVCCTILPMKNIKFKIAPFGGNLLFYLKDVYSSRVPRVRQGLGTAQLYFNGILHHDIVVLNISSGNEAVRLMELAHDLTCRFQCL